MRKRNLCIFLFVAALIFSGNTSYSQNLKKLLKQGTEAMADKDYFSASQIYGKVVLIDSTNNQYLYSYATASRLNFDLDIALTYYQKVYKVDNAKLFPETPYWIGQILKSKARYKEAKKYFNKYYVKNRKSKDAEIKRLAEKSHMEIDACELSLIMMKNPVPVTIEHLDTNVNSKVSEYAPIEVDSLLYFSSLRNKKDKDKKHNDISYNKIFISKRDSANKKAQWKRAAEMDTIINRMGVHTANTAFNKDFTEVVFSRCIQKNASTFSCKLYTSKHQGGQWTTPQELPSPVNIDGYNSTQPAVAEIDKETYLFFSSDRSGGLGGMDIWYCKKNSEVSYSNPVNAGSLVNSYEDEKTPYMEDITGTLYFSSNHHKGMGGYDIFESKFKEGKFTAPENVGYPINSPLNDVYYSINSKKDKAYISSNRIGSYFEEKQSCCNDIYAFSITPIVRVDTVKPVVIDSAMQTMNKMKVLVPLTLYFHNDEPDKKTLAITTKLNYKKTCLDYLAMQPLYLKEFPKGLGGDTFNIATNKVENFFEDSVQAGLNDLEKFALLLEDVLRRGETVKITMKGFCSPLASTAYNVNLAKRRISSLQNYFREYKDAMFVPYITNGKVIFYEEDVGELPKSTSSDDYYDTRNSIYNPKAASERKIQIIAVSEIR
ncbi:MAG: tetratricopeptide repeat protein [Bacteroidia bacterium]